VNHRPKFWGFEGGFLFDLIDGKFTGMLTLYFCDDVFNFYYSVLIVFCADLSDVHFDIILVELCLSFWLAVYIYCSVLIILVELC